MKTFDVLFKRPNGKVERGILQGKDEEDIKEELDFMGLKIVACVCIK